METVVAHHSQQNLVFWSICRSLAMSARSLVSISSPPGPFQNLEEGSLWYPCYSSNLQLGAPFMGQPDYNLNNIASVIWGAMLWSSVHLTKNCLRLRFVEKMYLKLNHQASRSTGTYTPTAWTGQRKTFTTHCYEMASHSYEKRGVL